MQYIKNNDKEKIKNELYDFYQKDYGDVENISQESYNLSIQLLEYLLFKPDVFLTNQKTVQFEYAEENKYLEIEVFDDRYEVFQQILGNGGVKEEMEKTIFPDEIFEIINIIKIFYRGNPHKSVLFTGAFNPPHIGHFHMIESALNKGFDYVIFALSNQKFLDKKAKKTGEKIVFNEKQRLEMILQMTYDDPRVLIFGIEEGYTYDVLFAVKEKYKMNKLFFAMGSDKLSEIERWGHHDKLLVEFQFYVLLRGSDDKNSITNKCNRIFNKTKYIIGIDNDKYKDISSTKVRKAIEENREYSDIVHKNVYLVLKKIVN